MSHELVLYDPQPQPRANIEWELALLFGSTALVVGVCLYQTYGPILKERFPMYNPSVTNRFNFFNQASSLISGCWNFSRIPSVCDQYIALLDEQEREITEIQAIMDDAANQAENLTEVLVTKIGNWLQKNSAAKGSANEESNAYDNQDALLDAIAELFDGYPELDLIKPPTEDDYHRIIKERSEHHLQLVQLVSLHLDNLQTLFHQSKENIYGMA